MDVVFCNKSSCYNKNMKLPHSKRNVVTITNMTSSSAKVVLSERNVQIKDLESKVKFLKTKIKDLEDENKLLQKIQSRQERELKKFKEGITDIPVLLKSHKEEIKAYESTISSIRKDLRDCQKELKFRNESLLKKESQINKMNVHLKQSENFINDYTSEIKVLKAAKKDLEEENKVLIKADENLKNENDDLCKQIKDLNLKILNLEENLIKENDLNKNLKCELNELKEKCEKNLVVQISSSENIQDCGNQTLCKTADDVSFKALDKIPSVGCMENETGKLENSSIKDTDEPNLSCVKSIDKAKDALIHSFKSYQHFCTSQLRNSDPRLFEIGSSNIKLLPPLKPPSKESSTSVISDIGKKKLFSAADVNFTDAIKYSHSDVSKKDFQRKFTAADNEIYKFKNKANISSHSKIKCRNNDFDFLSNDEIKDFQNDISCIKKTDMKESKTSQNSSFLSKEVTEPKKCRSLNKPLEMHDNLLCGNLTKRVQNILENTNVPDRYLKKENVVQSSENMNSCWENSMNSNDFHCKSNTGKYKAYNFKQGFYSKPIISCHFDEVPEQKSSETRFELPFWDK